MIFRFRITIFLVFASLLLFGQRDFSEAQANAISVLNIHKVIAIIMALFLSLHVIFRHGIVKKIPLAFRMYGLYIFIGIISALFFSTWLGYSIWKLVEISAVFFSVLSLWLTAYSNEEFIKNSYDLCLKFYQFLILLTVLGIAIFPQEAIQPANQTQEAFLPYTIFGTIAEVNPNSLGAISAILFYVNFVRLMSSEKYRVFNRYLWLIMSTIMLIFAQSRTSIAALLTVVFLYLLFSKKSSVVLRFTIIIFLILGIFSNLETLLLYLGRGYSIDRLQAMSGRTVWWENAFAIFQESGTLAQFFGLGFGTANRLILGELGYSGAATLHSDYIDTIISAGYLGVFFLCLSIIFSFNSIFKNFKIFRTVPFYSEVVGVFLIIFIRSFTGTSIASHNHFLIMFLILILIMVGPSIKLKFQPHIKQITADKI